jgi:hypothetical protein
LLALNISAQKSITIKISTKVNPFPKNTGLLIFIGIEFYKQEGNRFYNLENRKAMKVLKILRCRGEVSPPQNHGDWFQKL